MDLDPLINVKRLGNSVTYRNSHKNSRGKTAAVWCIKILEGFATRKTAAEATSTLANNWKKETKKISMFPELIRGNSTILAPTTAEEEDKKETMKEESLKSKSLYLCFERSKNCPDNAHVIQSIELSHLLIAVAPTDGDHGGDEIKLREVAYRCGPGTSVPGRMISSVIGSKIIFSGGKVYNRKKSTTPPIPMGIASKEVCVFETDPSIDPNPRLRPSQVFKTSRPEPFLVEVDDRLYCFSGPSDSVSFEVFDKTHERWLPLDAPPQRNPYSFCHAIAGTKILLWVKNQTGVYGFDVTHPEKGWTKLDSCLGSCIPYVNGYHQLFLKLKLHRGNVNGFLMLSCKLEQPQTVKVFHMSHECDSLKPMEPLQLPKWPHKFPRPTRCKFFHLEDEKVGIVFFRDHYEYYYEDYDYYDGDDDHDYHHDDNDDDDVNMEEEEEEDVSRVRILVIIFEYEIAEESMDIRYKLLTSRCLEYSPHNPEEVRNTTPILMGAYVI